ncbi:MAG: hypothetical protein AAGG38_10645 [Planctomycetota bacterium]
MTCFSRWIGTASVCFVMAASLGAGGCSGLVIQDGVLDSDDKFSVRNKEAGIVYYEPALYIRVAAVTSDSGDRANQIEVITLPDYSKPYRIKPNYGGGPLEWSVTLADGWRLVTVNGNADPQIDEFITAVIPSLSLLGIDKGAPDGASKDPLKPGLYKVEDLGRDGKIKLVEVELVPLKK